MEIASAIVATAVREKEDANRCLAVVILRRLMPVTI